VAVAAVLDELRGTVARDALRGHYRERDGDCAATVIARRGLSEQQQRGARRAEDAAYGLRWLELAHGRRFDLGRSLVPQIPGALVDDGGCR
jgi:hypothetical protein